MSQLKSICLDCCVFDPSQKDGYKCAVKGHCPGLDWEEKRKSRYLDYLAVSPGMREEIQESLKH